jgi:hypothetical protein
VWIKSQPFRTLLLNWYLGLYPSLLLGGTVQLRRGAILTKDYRIIQPDGTSRPADTETLRQVHKNPSLVGFKLPPDFDAAEALSGNDSDEGTLECQICFDKLAWADVTDLLCDACIYSKACLNQSLRISLTTRTLYPPKCACRQEIYLRDLGDVIEEDVLDLANSVPEEWASENQTYCGQEGWGAFIPAAAFISDKGEASDDNSRGQFGACSVCKVRSCWKCKQTQETHMGLCGKCPRESVSPELYTLIREKKLTRCPDCRILVELQYGCEDVQKVS